MYRAHIPALLRTHAIVLGIYTVLACIITWPLVPHLNTHLPAIPGELGQDVWQNAWNILWVRHALLVEHTNPFHTTMLFYPQGASLYLHTLNLPLGIVGIPLLSLTNMVVTYNLLTLLVLVLAGYGSFLLGKFLCTDKPAALVAGTIVVCSPYRLFELRSAQLPTVSDYAVPLALLAVLVALQRQTWRSALLVGGLLLVAGLSSWYHLFHILIILAVVFIWRTVKEWRTGERTLLRCELATWGRIAVTSTMVLAPFVVPVVLESVTASYVQKDDDLLFTADLLQLVPGTAGGRVMLVSLNRWGAYSFALIPWILALTGFVLVPRQVALWFSVALVCMLFALGPSLHIGTVDTGMTLPYSIFRTIPLLATFRAPARLLAVTTLMFGIMAAIGLARLWHNRSVHQAWLSAAIIIVLIVAESTHLSFPLVDGAVSPAYTQIAQQPGSWSILEFPFDRPDRLLLDMYNQVYHRKYILTGQTSRMVPRMAYESIPPFAQIEAGNLREDIVSLSPSARDQMLRALRVYYIVIHHDPNKYQRAERQAAIARQTLGPLTAVYSDSELLVYRLDHVADWLDGAGKTTRASVPLYLGLNLSWEKPEAGALGMARWLPPDGGGLWTYTQHPQRVVLDVSLYSLSGARPMEIWLNDQLVQSVPVSAGLYPRHYLSSPFELPVGPSLITLRAPQGGVSPRSLGIGNDERALSFSIHQVQLRAIR